MINFQALTSFRARCRPVSDCETLTGEGLTASSKSLCALSRLRGEDMEDKYSSMTSRTYLFSLFYTVI